MKTFRLIGMALLAVVMSVNFTSCSSDDEEDEEYTQWNPEDYDVITNNMAFTITNEGAILESANPNLAGHIEIPEEVYYEGTKTSYPVIAIYCAMNNCTKITSVSIPNTVETIGDDAFKDCTNLNNVVIPNSVLYIRSGAFGNCSSLTSVNIPNSVISIAGAFSGCTNLTKINISNGVKYMQAAFAGCTSLTSFTVPNSVEDIGNCFEGCTNLTSVVLPQNEKFTVLLGGAFANCKSLSTITIPSSIKRIYKGAFEGCEKLSSVRCLATTAPEPREQDYNFYNYFFTVTDILYIPKGSMDSYKNTYPWSEFKKIVEE